MNLGYMELTANGVVVRIYYDQTFVPGDGQTGDDAPLIDGPRGFCLDMTNTTGKNVKLQVDGLSGTSTIIQVGQGDPVTTGPSSGRSRTAAQMANLGFTTRGNVGSVELGG